MRWLLLAGVLGLALTLVGAVFSAREAAYSYLFAFAFWASAVVGALILLQSLHAARARWPVVFRRPIEVMAALAPALIALFIPVAIAAHALYPWVDPPPGLSPHDVMLYARKSGWLHLPFFLVRAAICLAVWSAVGVLLYRWSAAQDALGPQTPAAVALTSRQRRLAAGALPFVVITFSFASQDWLMSLEPLWYSTVYGLYVACGAVVAALCCVALWATFDGALAAMMRPEHFRRLGTLLLTFVCLWAYCGFSQYLLIWIATLPEEVTWYIARARTTWRFAAIALMVFHFGLPFLLLLQRRIKERPRALAVVAAGLLLMHGVDLYWLIVPALHPHGFSLHWTAPLAFVGVGALTAAAALGLRARGRAVPLGDPFLPHSLEVPGA